MPGDDEAYRSYISTDCRVGHHLDCQARRIIPGCPCECHHHEAARLGVFRCDLDGQCPACREVLEGVLEAGNDHRGFVVVGERRAERADVLVVSGNLTRDQQRVVLDACLAAPPRCRVLAVGDCTIGSTPADVDARGAQLREIVVVDAEIPGCPPRVEQIEEAMGVLLSR